MEENLIVGSLVRITRFEGKTNRATPFNSKFKRLATLSSRITCPTSTYTVAMMEPNKPWYSLGIESRFTWLEAWWPWSPWFNQILSVPSEPARHAKSKRITQDSNQMIKERNLFMYSEKKKICTLSSPCELFVGTVALEVKRCMSIGQGRAGRLTAS